MVTLFAFFLVSILVFPSQVQAGNSFGLIITAIVAVVSCIVGCEGLLLLGGVLAGEVALTSTVAFTVLGTTIFEASALSVLAAYAVTGAALTTGLNAVVGSTICPGSFDAFFGECKKSQYKGQKIYTNKNVKFEKVELSPVPTPEQFAANSNASGDAKVTWHADAPNGIHEFLRIYDQDTGGLIYSGGLVDANGIALAAQGDVNGYLGPGTGNGVSCAETSRTDTLPLPFQHSYFAEIRYDACYQIKGGKLTKKAVPFCQDNGENCGDMSYAGVQNSSGVLATYEFSTPSIPSPKVSLSGNGVIAGKPLTLSWSTHYATTCSASGDWSGGKSVNGSEVVIPSSDDNSYTLTCTTKGKTGSATYSNKLGAGKTVDVFGSTDKSLQILDFNTTKPINPGDNVTISWSVIGSSISATECLANPDQCKDQANSQSNVQCTVDNGIGSVPNFGTVVIKFFKPITLTLTCTDSAGKSVSATKTIDVKKIPQFIETAPKP